MHLSSYRTSKKISLKKNCINYRFTSRLKYITKTRDLLVVNNFLNRLAIPELIKILLQTKTYSIDSCNKLQIAMNWRSIVCSYCSSISGIFLIYVYSVYKQIIQLLSKLFERASPVNRMVQNPYKQTLCLFFYCFTC